MTASRNYPVAWAASAVDSHEAVIAALSWIVDVSRHLDGQIMLYVRNRQDIERDPALREFSKQPGITTATWRVGCGRWAGGPVLAVWPDRNHLAKVAGDERTAALCVIASTGREIDRWMASTAPDKIGPI